MKRSDPHGMLYGCLGVVLLGCLMQAAAVMKDAPVVLPEVKEILRELLRLLGEERTWQLMGITMTHVVISMAIATVLGVALGVLQGLWNPVRQLLRPLMALLRSLPMVVLVIIIMVMTRNRSVPVIVCVVVLAPMISEAACEGCLGIDRELIDVYRMNGRFGLRVLWRVYLPLMAGYLRQAWVNAAGMSLKLAVSAEYLVQTKNSLGKAVINAVSDVEYTTIYAYALLMVLLVLILGEGPMLIARCATAIRERHARRNEKK